MHMSRGRVRIQHDSACMQSPKGQHALKGSMSRAAVPIPLTPFDSYMPASMSEDVGVCITHLAACSSHSLLDKMSKHNE